MNVAFTICSNNYLAQAKALGDSLISNNPEYKFYIGLVDKLSSDIDYARDIAHDIILVEEIGIQNFDDLWKKYDIIELNTCVKPMVFKYLFNKHPNTDLFFYFDPDILIYNSLNDLEGEFVRDSSVLLTPHILNPIPIDGKSPFENTFLNYGIYNLGFLGLKNDGNSISLLNWWEARTVNYGFSNVENGFFVDQLWFNLVPLFFDNVKILKNLGYNMGPWNLHERTLSNSGSDFLVNNNFKLSFFHFSNYKYTSPDLIATYYNRYQLSDFASLKLLYTQYHDVIIKNKVGKYSVLKCHYVLAHQKHKEDLIYEKEKLKLEDLNKNKKYRIKQSLKKFIPPILIRMYRAI